MKATLQSILLLLALAHCSGAPFRNLDFQSPNLRALAGLGPSGTVQVQDAIPGWQLATGGQADTLVAYNAFCLTCPGAALYGPENPKRGDTFSFGINAGRVSVDPLVLVSESVFQTGDVPSDAHSLQFVGNIGPSLDLLHVFLGGQELPLVKQEPVGFGFRFGADITAWAGKTAELRFTIEPGSSPFYGGAGLGDIRFSSVALVPEPATWALFGLGGALLLWVSKRSSAK